MSNAVKRLVEVAGENFDHPKCRVTNPHITARESIEVGNYIVELECRLERQMRSNEELAQWITAILNGHQQVPDWIKQSAKSLLVSQATKGK